MLDAVRKRIDSALKALVRRLARELVKAALGAPVDHEEVHLRAEVRQERVIGVGDEGALAADDERLGRVRVDRGDADGRLGARAVDLVDDEHCGWVSARASGSECPGWCARAAAVRRWAAHSGKAGTTCSRTSRCC